MSFTIHGLGVSPGIAIGHAHLVSHAMLEVSHYVVPAKHLEGEVARFDAAVESVRQELDGLRESTPADAPSEMPAFIDLHALILADPLLSSVPRELIAERRCNAEWALVRQMEELIEQFDEIADPYLRERKQDVMQVVERVLKALLGLPGHLPPRRGRDGSTVVVAHDLSPADMIHYKQHQISGFVTNLGGATSHTAIVARSLKLPAVVGLHHVRELIRDDDLLIVDGTRGVLIVEPDELVLQEYRLRKTELEVERSKLLRLRSARAATLDGKDISLQANIELPQDIPQVREVDAAGIGLFRTEFLFLNREESPDEDEQFEAYRSVAQAMRGKPVTIRTLDVGADKALRGAKRTEPNPALGLRAIRFCLADPPMFLTQLRAILRASHYGRVRLLLPMLAHGHEIDQTLQLLGQAREELRSERVKFDEHMEVGGMVEVPAAALALGVFLKRLSFLSIGTNDLIQYTLAIDRTDEAVAYLYDPLHPAVLRLVAQTIQTAIREGRPVAVCGEMAGDPALTKLLIGMGLREFSMHPSQILLVKQEVLRSDATKLNAAVSRLLRLDDVDKVREQVDKLNAS
jgi:phosphotransferase system enzyme I (PtsI)